MRTRQYAEAVKEFERAHALAPGDSGIARNLRAAGGLLRKQEESQAAP